MIGVDIGGTFTDVVLTRPGHEPVLGKLLTTPNDPSDAVVTGITDVLGRSGTEPASIARIAHATTLATNTILERRGVDVAFVTTAGFRDMLTLGRGARVEDQRFDIMFDPPVPPIAPDRCFEVVERIAHDGTVVVPFDDDGARRLAAKLATLHVDAVAICFLHSYADATHEMRMADLCRHALPGIPVVTSSSIWPEMREYERATTTVMSAYVGPVMARYLGDLSRRLTAIGINAPVHIMDSSGGVMSAELAAQRAVYTIESGPAAGVMAARHVGAEAGVDNVISFDMGGTTAKAGVIRNGRVEVTRSFHVGGTGSFGGHREGSGIPIKAATIDLAEVGSGGGSIAWIDDGGALRVGPKSAGSSPGPACYGLGGTSATVTDANVVLGYLDPASLADGALALHPDLAEHAVAVIAKELSVDGARAAHAIHAIANANMIGAVHVVTVQRGIDPRRFTMVAFGGAGPMHATSVAAAFGIERILVPRGCGVASAFGLLTTDMVAERGRTVVTPATGADPRAVATLFEELAQAACDDLGLARDAVTVEHLVDVRYVGQSHELTVELPDGPVDAASIAGLSDRFHERYVAAYGSTIGGPIELVSFRARVTCPVDGDSGVTDLRPGHPATTTTSKVPARSRQAYFPELGGWIDTPILRRDALPTDGSLAGPVIIEEADSTTVVPSGWSASLDPAGVIVLDAVR